MQEKEVLRLGQRVGTLVMHSQAQTPEKREFHYATQSAPAELPKAFFRPNSEEMNGTLPRTTFGRKQDVSTIALSNTSKTLEGRNYPE